MNERNWKEYLENNGKIGVIADLLCLYAGRPKTTTFTNYWYGDEDTGDENFQARVEKLIGKKLYKKIKEIDLQSNQQPKHKK